MGSRIDPRLAYPDCTTCGSSGIIHVTLMELGFYCYRCEDYFTPPVKWQGIEFVEKEHRNAWIALEIQGYTGGEYAKYRNITAETVERWRDEANERRDRKRSRRSISTEQAGRASMID